MSDHLASGPSAGRGEVSSGPGTRRHFLGRSGGAVAGALLGPGTLADDPAPTKPPARPGAPRPGTLLVKDAAVLVTMDANRREVKDGGLFIRNGLIEQAGPTADLPRTADEVLDLAGHVVFPGLVNTHHHLFQTLTRAVPGCQEGGVATWLKVLYPLWARLTPEAIRVSTLTGLAELALSGCTTCLDQLYVFPNGCRLDDAIVAAREIGVRFHAGRGSMSIAGPGGAGPPASCVEKEDVILDDCRRVIEAYHDPKPAAMTRVVLAPSALSLVSPDFLRETARLARGHRVTLHMHLAKSRGDERFTLAKYGVRPIAFLDGLGWIGDDVSFAHAIHVDDAEVALLARKGCGVAHCPSSSMRHPSGIPRVKAYRDAGVKVGVGVDTSANDSGHMLAELRMAMLLARVLLGLAPGDPPEDPSRWLSARDVLEMGTRGGAAILGRDDIGSLEPGKCADFFSLNLTRVDFAGALHDPVAAAVFCAPQKADTTVIDGRVIVREGHLTTIDLPKVVEQQNRIARALS